MIMEFETNDGSNGKGHYVSGCWFLQGCRHRGRGREKGVFYFTHSYGVALVKFSIGS